MTNGEEYTGHMFGNQYHGEGTLTFADDDKHGRKTYTGNFENGKFHGNGTMEYKSRNKCEATWIEGVVHGPGKLLST